MTPPGGTSTRYTQASDGAHLAYQVVGTDGPDLVLGLENPCPVDAVWDDPRTAGALRRLASFSRLILFDRRGTGGSDPVAVAQPHVLEDDVDDVATIMDAAGSTTATLLGTGAVGPLAILFAASQPDRLDGLVLVNTYARLTQAPDYRIGLPGRMQEMFLEASSSWGNELVGIDFLARSRAADPSFRAWLARSMRLATSPGLAKAALEMILSIDVRAVLPLVRTRTLVLHSTADPFVRADHGRYIADAVFGARFVALPGDGHILPSVDLGALVSEVEEFVTGARDASEPERALATLVFTDIVGSTEKAATVGDTAWRELLDNHDDLVRHDLDRFAGQLIKTTGDGLVATFDGPARAIRFAVALQDELRRRDIDIRVGIHAGEVERRGNDVGGIAVHIAARVQAAAGAGEIVVSRTVTDLVAGSSLRFDDLGEHELKGIAQPWHLFRLAR